MPAPGDWDRKVFGQFGVLDVDEFRVVCHACGAELGSLIGHIGKAHDLTADEYRAIFALPSTAALVSAALSRLRREQAADKLGAYFGGTGVVPLTREQVDEAQRRYNTRERDNAAFLARVGRPVSPRSRKPLDPCIVCGKPVPNVIRRTGRRTCSDGCRTVAIERDQRRLGEAARLTTKRCSTCGEEKPVEAFDHQENAQRRYRPFCRACGDPRRKIQPSDRASIIQRVEAGESQSAIARALGVSSSRISQLVQEARHAAE